MNIDNANEIIKIVDGGELDDRLSTIALALIHMCMENDLTKDEMLAAIDRQWDLYARQMLEHHAQKGKSN